MASGVNKVILVGNLGADPEVRQTQDGRPIVNLRVATSDSWRDKATGERREKTEWHRVVIFNENVSFDHYFATYPKAANIPGETQQGTGTKAATFTAALLGISFMSFQIATQTLAGAIALQVARAEGAAARQL